MGKIKLLKVDTLDNGTVRLQSQLLVGSDTADFVLRGGTLMMWRNGDRGFGFYETDIPHEIVTDKKEIMFQEL